MRKEYVFNYITYSISVTHSEENDHLAVQEQ